MRSANWPNWKEGLIWGSIFGTAAALFRLAVSYEMSQIQYLTDDFRPWREQWPIAVIAFAIVFICVGILGAIRPRTRKK
jgi:hypothetical protein